MAIKKSLGFLMKNLLNILLVVIFVFPFAWMVVTSLKTLGQTLQMPPGFIVKNPQWDNFVRAFEAIPFLHMLKNSLIVVTGTLLCQVVTVIPAAYAFARYDFKGRKILFGITLVTMMIPAQLIFLPVFLMFSKLGLINSYLSLILPSATSAFAIFMLRQTFMQVPKELVEAAKLDGASEGKIITRIMLPIARPTLVTLGLITFISSWNDYFWPFVLTTNDAVRTLPVGIAALRTMEGGLNYHIIMAGNVLLIIPVLIVFVIAQRQIMDALSYTGIK
ncbi:carbohydrate ABC transporter permease [Anaerosphaera multitolerans]|uniref:Carbohydrate ABC transporter permease n=1 Tax=Anaerosphaera multitolerans TaxID=2487351 RepID=A0A437SA68_9FIRM|nr:carbohydrate ABC transporter permease [Anaerosphaera multitolerans]RVU55707.1 carbohydrate ABC transporter permease [Anaerosphaera multitolerans]